MAYAFSKLPTGWTRKINDDIASFLGGSQAGESIAALKCLLAISVQMDFTSRTATVSYTDFETLTGLSRPMVTKGIKALETRGLITIGGGHTHKYTVNEIQDEHWAKLPTELLKRSLKDIGNRGVICLAALKIYILLVTRRNNIYQWTALTFDQIELSTGVRRTNIRAALSMLFSAGLIHSTIVDPNNGQPVFPAYLIRGLSIKAPDHAFVMRV